MIAQRVLNVLAALAFVAGVWLALAAPPDAVQGEYARILHVHVPSSWLAYLSFGITMIGSIAWLISKRFFWDRLAASSAEIGVFFTALSILTGMIWGYPVWGKAWDWGDARLVTTAVMLFVYVSYLALRRTIDDPRSRATRSAALGMTAFILVPIGYFSTVLWRTLHPGMTITPEGSSMNSEMLVAFLANLAAFTILYLAFLVSRMRLARLEAAVVASTETAGSVVTPPDLGLIDG